MSPVPSDIAFTASVKAIQARKGSRVGYRRMEEKGGWSEAIDASLARFIAERDSFYLATAAASGQPYVQHRGGRPGFLKVIDARTLAFADFKGNRQYISQGNLAENPRAFIFLMDYGRRRRVKIWGSARVVEGDPALLASLADDEYDGVPEQAVVFHVAAWDVNCPQHITPRFTEDEVAGREAELRRRIAALEAERAELRRALAQDAPLGK